MLKSERHNVILDKVNANGVASVATLLEILNVSTMTIRRDLAELDEKGLLIKVHGGAQSTVYDKEIELSHFEKQELNMAEKREAAKYASSLIVDGDTIFLGAGTTIELMAEYMHHKYLRIVTNSLPVFEKFKHQGDFELYLIGGVYRERTGAFVGGLTSEIVQSLKFQKSFIGVNGIKGNRIYTANIEEGSSQKIILDNSQCKIIVADHDKFDREDFNSFYSLGDIDLIVTDQAISKKMKQSYEKFVRILNHSNQVHPFNKEQILCTERTSG